MKLQAAIDTARQVLNDPDGVTYTGATLLGYANDALDAILTLAPQWFHTRAALICIAGPEQALSFADAHALVAVERVTGGGAVMPCERMVFDRYNPAWSSDTAGQALNWMASLSSQVAFSVYPPALAGQSLDVLYVRTPDEYTASADTGLPDTLAPAIADYIVAMAMSQDDEHVLAQRSTQFMSAFTAFFGGT